MWRCRRMKGESMAIDEIAPDTYRISTYVPEINLQFNQFLVADEEPLLYHTGMRGLFPRVLEEVSRVIDPARLRWVGFSHFESDIGRASCRERVSSSVRSG